MCTCFKTNVLMLLTQNLENARRLGLRCFDVVFENVVPDLRGLSVVQGRDCAVKHKRKEPLLVTAVEEVDHLSYGLFTLTETDLDSDSKHDGYIVICRTCSHSTGLHSDPYSLFLCRTGIRVRVCTRVRLEIT